MFLSLLANLSTLSITIVNIPLKDDIKGGKMGRSLVIILQKIDTIEVEYEI